MKKSHRQLRIGILGCGPIAQNAHFDAVRKAWNAELYAICDVAPDLLERMGVLQQPRQMYARYDDMLADPLVEAIIIAVDDRFHAALCMQALYAGKHVLVEKPLGVTVEECQALQSLTHETGLVVQIGNNRRFHPGWIDARRFVQEEMGEIVSFSAWYHDSIYRYTMQDNLYPLPVTSNQVRRPTGAWKEIPERYFLLTHGSHLLDTALFFLDDIIHVGATHIQHNDMHCWTIDATFARGCHGQLRLLVPAHADFQEGFQMYGEHGSVVGTALLPWFQQASVECFRDGRYSRLLGEDGSTFRRQIEAFADTILNDATQLGATIDDGAAAVRALVAISQSVASAGKPVRLTDVTGEVRVPRQEETPLVDMVRQ